MMNSTKNDFAAVAAARLVDRYWQMASTHTPVYKKAIDEVADIIRQAQADVPTGTTSLANAALSALQWFDEASNHAALLNDLSERVTENPPIDELRNALTANVEREAQVRELVAAAREAEITLRGAVEGGKYDADKLQAALAPFKDGE